jgi:hypothetical protein
VGTRETSTARSNGMNKEEERMRPNGKRERDEGVQSSASPKTRDIRRHDNKGSKLQYCFQRKKTRQREIGERERTDLKRINRFELSQLCA